MTSPQHTDDEIAGFLIGNVDPAVWGWPVIDARFAHAYAFALGVAHPVSPGSAAHDATAEIQRGLRVRDIIARRWAEAAEAHPDPDARPSLR